MFNLIGVLIFLPIPFVKDLPLRLANGLGRLTLRYRLVGFSYLFFTFFFIPFLLIYLSKGVIGLQETTYEREEAGIKSQYTLIVRKFNGNQFGGWSSNEQEKEIEGTLKIISVYRKNYLLIINNELFELNKEGFCKDGEDEMGKYKACIVQILPHLKLTDKLEVDSVFVFERQFYEAAKYDSVTTRYYISANENLLVKKELRDKNRNLMSSEKLVKLQRK